MKHYIFHLFVSILTVFFCSCKNEPEPDPDNNTQEAIILALQGSWEVSEVRKENTIISDFSNLILTIDGRNYTTQNGEPIWPSSGSFDFENIETIDEFIRQDGRLFTARIVDGDLNIVLIYQEETARGEYGTFEFVLSK